MKVESLHVGLNRLNPAAYSGWPGWLNAAVHDARDLTTIAARYGCQARALLDDMATIEAVEGELASAAERLQPGDAFVFTYSGHGSTSPLFTDEDVQSFVLYDGEFSDRKFRRALWEFRAGVRVVCLLDTCFSGGLDRAGRASARLKPSWVRALTRATEPQSSILAASVLFLTASSVQELSMDGERNGAWTGAMLGTLSAAEKAGRKLTWQQWHEETEGYMSLHFPLQHPQLIHASAETVSGSLAWTFDTQPSPPVGPPVFPSA